MMGLLRKGERSLVLYSVLQNHRAEVEWNSEAVSAEPLIDRCALLRVYTLPFHLKLMQDERDYITVGDMKCC